MIESCYWKEALIDHAKRLNPVKTPPRWTERAAVVFERDVIVSFFYVRKLIECHKVSSKTKNHKVSLYSSHALGKPVTLLNRFDVDELYDFSKERAEKKSISFVANQFIHSYIVFPYRNERRQWAGFFVCSDRERSNAIYKIEIAEVQKVFNCVGNDYPRGSQFVFSEAIGDYRVVTN